MSVSYRLPVDTKDKKTKKEKANEKKASWTDSEEVQTFSQSLGRWFLNLDIFFFSPGVYKVNIISAQQNND